MMKAQMAGNPAQIHPVHVQLQRFLADFVGIGPSFLFRGVLDLTEHTAKALAAAACFSSSVLAFRSMTFWTFHHVCILASLAQLLATP